MANEPTLGELLRKGIEAARNGEKVNARYYLTQALEKDANNETALMWMASVTDAISERRGYLQRALDINPNNDRAREALRRIAAQMAPPTPASESGINDANTPRRPQQDIRDYVPRPRAVESRRGLNGYLIAALLVTAAVVIVVLVALAASQPQQTVVSGDTLALTFAAVTAPPRPTADEGPLPTATFFGIIVTQDPNAEVLPPTFTPTPTLEPTETPTPTPTPLPLGAYRVVFSSLQEGDIYPSLFSARADGSELNAFSLEGGVAAFAVSPEGGRIVFVRGGAAAAVTTSDGEDGEASEEGEGEAEESAAAEVATPQLYLAPLNDPGSAIQLTNLTGSSLVYPSWSPDGERIVFASDDDGDLELFIINADGTGQTQITNNTGLDTSPIFAPDGQSIVFASDFESPGFTEIYLREPNGNTIRLTDDAGSSFAPAFSPDGTRIAFVSDRSGDADIYIMDANGQRPFLLTIDDNNAEDRMPAFSRDGRFIVFASNRSGDTFGWYAIDLSAGNAISPLTIGEGDADMLGFLP